MSGGKFAFYSTRVGAGISGGVAHPQWIEDALSHEL